MEDDQEISGDDVTDVADLLNVGPATLTGVLRKSVLVAGDGDPPNSPLKVIPAGTPADEIPQSERAQLCQEHFA